VSQAQEIWGSHQGGGAGAGEGEERTPLLAPGGMLQRYIESGGTLYEGEEIPFLSMWRSWIRKEPNIFVKSGCN